MIVIKCPSCCYKQFCTDDEFETDEVICRNCGVTVSTRDGGLSIQALEPSRVAEWCDQLDPASRNVIMKRTAELQRELYGYNNAGAWEAAVHERIQQGDALHKFFEPKQDDDFVRSG